MVEKIRGKAVVEHLGAGAHASQVAVVEGDVVIRVANPDDPSQDVWPARAEATRKINRGEHPSLVALVGKADPTSNEPAMLAYEHIQGALLSDLSDALTGDEAARVVLALADGLGALHDIGVAHGGVRPTQVRLRTNLTPVLLDVAATWGSADLDPSDDVTALIALALALPNIPNRDRLQALAHATPTLAQVVAAVQGHPGTAPLASVLRPPEDEDEDEDEDVTPEPAPAPRRATRLSPAPTGELAEAAPDAPPAPEDQRLPGLLAPEDDDETDVPSPARQPLEARQTEPLAATSIPSDQLSDSVVALEHPGRVAAQPDVPSTGALTRELNAAAQREQALRTRVLIAEAEAAAASDNARASTAELQKTRARLSDAERASAAAAAELSEVRSQLDTLTAVTQQREADIAYAAAAEATATAATEQLEALAREVGVLRAGQQASEAALAERDERIERLTRDLEAARQGATMPPVDVSPTQTAPAEPAQPDEAEERAQALQAEVEALTAALQAAKDAARDATERAENAERRASGLGSLTTSLTEQVTRLRDASFPPGQQRTVMPVQAEPRDATIAVLDPARPPAGPGLVRAMSDSARGE